MDQVLVETAKQVPALVVLVVVVWMFVKSMSKIGSECHTTQRAATDAINNNTQVLGEIRGILMRIDKNGRT